ncbi:hypothetical protein SDC9_144195 [bioreactor metagenome]|uniref:Uncharacterized protein n=1 Tax=bioreactor metagenome TaxID=1076179 RepID=A0A645E5E5_9ZZZZ
MPRERFPLQARIEPGANQDRPDVIDVFPKEAKAAHEEHRGNGDSPKRRTQEGKQRHGGEHQKPRVDKSRPDSAEGDIVCDQDIGGWYDL